MVLGRQCHCLDVQVTYHPRIDQIAQILIDPRQHGQILYRYLLPTPKMNRPQYIAIDSETYVMLSEMALIDSSTVPATLKALVQREMEKRRLQRRTATNHPTPQTPPASINPDVLYASYIDRNEVISKYYSRFTDQALWRQQGGIQYNYRECVFNAPLLLSVEVFLSLCSNLQIANKVADANLQRYRQGFFHNQVFVPIYIIWLFLIDLICSGKSNIWIV